MEGLNQDEERTKIVSSQEEFNQFYTLQSSCIMSLNRYSTTSPFRFYYLLYRPILFEYVFFQSLLNQKWIGTTVSRGLQFYRQIFNV